MGNKKQIKNIRFPINSKRENLQNKKMGDDKMNKNKITVVDAPCGFGKAQPLDSLILGENGYIEMKDIKVGHKIFGDDGELHNVIGVFPQGIKDIYEIEFSSGEKVKCCDEHLWTYQTKDNRKTNKYKTNSLKEIMKMKLYNVRKEGYKTWNLYIPICNPVKFKHIDIDIDPWLLGVLLGDGCIAKNKSPKISNSEEDIINKIKHKINDLNMDIHQINDCDYRIVNRQIGFENKINSKLKKYNLLDKKSYDKFVPKEYLYNDVNTRIEILRGIIDTDGSICNNGTIDYATTSKQLSEDVKFLAESLGGTVYVSERITKYTYLNEVKEGKKSYRLRITPPESIKFYSSKKHESKVTVKRQRNPYRQIRKITYIGKEKCQCIMVDNPSHLYLTNHCVVTHNTSWAIQYMNEEIFERFIYITPFLSELDRVIKSCTNRKFRKPNEKLGEGSKTNHFYRLLKEGNNVVSTHSLFKGVSKEVIDEIKNGEYILILDEVMDVVENLDISKRDIQMLINEGIISIDDNDKVYWLDEEYIGKFGYLKNPIKNGDVYLFDNSLILWTFPCDVFNAFKKVYILTYMFKGQIQRYYYDLNNLEYEYKSVNQIENKYELTDYAEINGSRYKDLINIYEGKLNDIGEKNTALSKGWYQRASKKEVMKQLKNNTENYYQNILKSKSKDNMYTTFEGYKSQVKGKGYTKGFVSCNCRATNEYKEKTNCAYLINRYYNPMINRFFTDKGVIIDEDTWALSELIQWLFRSGIRDENKINLYIPSSRMRVLLKKWLCKQNA